MKSIFTIQLATFNKAVALKVAAPHIFAGHLYAASSELVIAGGTRTSVDVWRCEVDTFGSDHVAVKYFDTNADRDNFINELTEALLECANKCEAFDSLRDGRTAPIAIISENQREIFI